MKEIALSQGEIAEGHRGAWCVSRRFRAPRWWEGHRIVYNAYPFGPGTTGRYAETMSGRDGGPQRRNPHGEPGDLLRPQGTTLTLEIVSVELAGNTTAERLRLRAWVLELRRVDADRQPKTLAEAYEDLPAKTRAFMVRYALKKRAEHLAALGPLQVGDSLEPAHPGAQKFTLTLLAPVKGSMFDARIDRGDGDVREGFYDIDRHRGGLYAGPDWKRAPAEAAP